MTTVELLGLARVLSGQERLALCLPADATLRDVTRALAASCPALVGPVLGPDGGLAAGTVFSLDGRAITSDLDQPVPEALGKATAGCRSASLILLTSMEGG